MADRDEIQRPPSADANDVGEWERTTRALIRIARSIVGDQALSEDVVQNTWLTAVEAGRSDGRIGWLRSIVRTRALDMRRRRRGEVTSPERFDELDGGGTRADEVAERIETQRAVLDAVDALDEPYRQTVYLRYFEGLSVRQVAARTGVPLKTAETRLTRGLARLRARLAPRYRDGSSGVWLPVLVAFAAPRTPLVSAAVLGGGLSALLLAMKKLALAIVVISALAALGWFVSVGGGGGPAGSGPAPDVEETAVDDREGADLAEVDAPAEAARVELGAADGTPVIDDVVAVAAPSAGALRVTLTWSDGTPAAQVGVVVITPWESGVRRRVLGVSNDEGAAYFADLAPGPYDVVSDRGSYDEETVVEIAAGETSTCAIELPEGIDVMGRVVDAEGRPVAGAEVVMTSLTGGWTKRTVVTRSARDGAFRVRDARDGTSFGALARGFERSDLVDLDVVERADGRAEIELVVGPGGASVTGVVTDGEGAPVGGALVAIGKFTGRIDMRLDGSHEEFWGGHVVRADEEGRYRVDSVPAGTHPLRVRAAGHPQWSGEVEIGSSEVVRVDITMPASASLSGIARDAAGRPVPGARVHAFDGPLDESYLQTGQIDYYGAFAHEMAVADDAGSFAFECLPAGTSHLYAMGPRPGRGADREAQPYARHRLTLEAGEEATWNPVIADGPTIEGSVRYRDGSPLKSIFVVLTRSDGKGTEDRAVHSSDGRFRFIQLEGSSYDVRAQIWELPEGAEEPRVIGVAPGSDPVELVADFDPPVKYAASKISVGFVDDGERAGAAPVSVTLERIDKPSWQIGERDGDRWTFDVNTPGRYRPLALADERLIAAGEAFDFVPGEPLDLGTFRSGPGGTLIVRLAGDEQHAPEKVIVRLRHESCRRSQKLEMGRAMELRVEGVEPGSASLWISGANFITEQPEFEIAAGEEVVVEATLVPAVRIRYHVDLPSLASATSFEVHFVDVADGSVLGRIAREDIGPYGSELNWSVLLPPGQYRMEARLGDGRAGTAEVTVPALGADDLPSPSVDLR